MYMYMHMLCEYIHVHVHVKDYVFPLPYRMVSISSASSDKVSQGHWLVGICSECTSCYSAASCPKKGRYWLP